MKTMTKFMFSALCAAAMVTSVSAQGGTDMLSNGIKYLDVPYVAHTLEADGPEELVINCDEMCIRDRSRCVRFTLASTLDLPPISLAASPTALLMMPQDLSLIHIFLLFTWQCRQSSS